MAGNKKKPAPIISKLKSFKQTLLMRNSERAFSLIDLLGAICIAGIIISSGAYGFSVFRKSGLIRREAGRTRAFIESLFLTVMESGAEAEILVEERSLKAFFSNERDKPFLVIPLKSPVLFGQKDIGRTIHVYPSGALSPTRLTLVEGTASCSVFISLRGRTRSECVK